MPLHRLGIFIRLLIAILAIDLGGTLWCVLRLRAVVTSVEPAQNLHWSDVLGALLPVIIGVLVLHVALGLGAMWSWRRGTRRLAVDLQSIESLQSQVRVRKTGLSDLDALGAQLNNTLGALAQEIERSRDDYRKARAIVRSMPGAVVALDNEQRVLDVNRVGERLLGIQEERTQGRLLQEVLRSEALLTFVRQAFAKSGATVGEFLLNTNAGDQRVVQANSQPLKNASGQLVGRVIVLQDVTRLRRLERVRRDFATNVSHELRTPITNIKGYVETLLELGPNEAAQSERFLQIVARNADRLTRIIEGMLELAKLDDPAAPETLSVAMVSIPTIVQSVIAQCQDTLGDREMKIHVSVPEDLYAVANARLIEQALHNLVSNAMKYGNPGSTIQIAAHQNDQKHSGDTESQGGDRPVVELSVFSQGKGIEKKHLPRLFERFYRVDESRALEQGGMGLGLAIVKHITRLHGGREGVESAPGKGVRFWIRIPIQGPIKNMEP